MPGNPNTRGNPAKIADDKRPFDVVFLHDATGSQQPYIDAARDYVIETLDDIDNISPGKPRYRVVAFRDHSDSWIVHDSNKFVFSHSELKAQLAELKASGGGDGPEAQIDALDAVLRSDWRDDALRVVILITDAPPHGIGEPGDVVPASHPDELTSKAIQEKFMRKNTHLTVVGCIPEIDRYKTAVPFYTKFAEATGGSYIKLPKPNTKPGVMKRAMVGAVLNAADSLRIEDRWADWVVDRSDRGHDKIVDDMHSRLSAERAECHEVTCTEHGGHDVKYHRGPVTRARVDRIVGKALRQRKLAESTDMGKAFLGMMRH
ncbi:hypothetical protein C8R45DRAFT_1008530 [Mycena sanguinolenta]|nr:hypothetical protein C8R45DRAFT_1008530 [Mycena sanguinolenta]